MKKSFLVILARIERKLKPYKGQSCFGPFNFPHLVKVREQGLDHGVLEAELCVPLLAVPGGPGAEHGVGQAAEAACKSETFFYPKVWGKM